MDFTFDIWSSGSASPALFPSNPIGLQVPVVTDESPAPVRQLRPEELFVKPPPIWSDSPAIESLTRKVLQKPPPIWSDSPAIENLTRKVLQKSSEPRGRSLPNARGDMSWQKNETQPDSYPSSDFLSEKEKARRHAVAAKLMAAKAMEETKQTEQRLTTGACVLLAVNAFQLLVRSALVLHAHDGLSHGDDKHQRVFSGHRRHRERLLVPTST
eukprot:TRINITY_DN17662_c0_g1_i8.p1 TRINITY_DN17662_c0_g1~~TRINITY_DN17662_c0_g1_i8.p1  ORF type:complete len:213 (-),score=34.05 TRINITY_DN17662_c0_g1_i8:87-725(-)